MTEDVMKQLKMPSWEEDERGSAIPACAECYGTIVDAVFWKSKEANKQASEDSVKLGGPADVHLYGIKATLKVKGHSNPSFDNWKVDAYFALNGGMAWKTRVIAETAGLDYLLACLNPAHPDYDKDSAPSFDGWDLDEAFERMAQFYITGSLVDAEGNIFESPNGGVLNKQILIKIAEPRIVGGVERTGNINPLRTTPAGAR